jgi:Na+-driven multidrug efflux pump
MIIITPVLYHFFIFPKYHQALKYSYLLCIGSFLWAISYFFYAFLLYHKQKKQILILSVCCIVVSLCCNYFFISKWKDFGGALASAVSYFIVFLITLFFTEPYWKKFLFKENRTLQ